MLPRNRHLPMTPAGLIVDCHEAGPDGLIVHAHGGDVSGKCPGCGSLSVSVHSRYVRSPRDVPAFGRGLIIRLTTRRFRCAVPSCDRKTFAERFAPEVIATRARRTSRLDCLVHGIGVVLGGRPGERLSERLSMPVSADTLLRTLRRRSASTPTSTKVVGLDDFAWRRGHRYGTIVCDLEQRRIIDLLADREIGTVTAWLKAHPTIEIVCRDRGGGYREAATKGAPRALRGWIDRRFPLHRLRPRRLRVGDAGRPARGPGSGSPGDPDGVRRAPPPCCASRTGAGDLARSTVPGPSSRGRAWRIAAPTAPGNWLRNFHLIYEISSRIWTP